MVRILLDQNSRTLFFYDDRPERGVIRLSLSLSLPALIYYAQEQGDEEEEEEEEAEAEACGGDDHRRPRHERLGALFRRHVRPGSGRGARIILGRRVRSASTHRRDAR